MKRTIELIETNLTSVSGYYNRFVVVSGLAAYWNYSGAIVAHIIAQNGEELVTAVESRLLAGICVELFLWR